MGKQRQHWGTLLLGIQLAGCVGSVSGGDGRGGNGPYIDPKDQQEWDSTVKEAGLTTPGRVTLHKLNNQEYDNTVRDLTGLSIEPSTEFTFPTDPHGAVFYNDATALGLSPLHVEQYLAAAKAIAERALATSSATTRNRIMVCTPVNANAQADCAAMILQAFATRAFRRPVTDEEMAPYAGLVATALADGETFDAAISYGIQAILVAPDFLYRVEFDPKPGIAHPLSDYELASRLSYFLWSTMPDDELFAKAATGGLNKPAAIAAEIERMLADPKAAVLPKNLANQWLAGNDLGLHDPAGYAGGAYADFDADLRDAMEQELTLFFDDIMRGDVAASELLTGKFTYANKTLATHYGLPNAASLGNDFVKVDLTGTDRGGILRQGAYLVGTSHSENTSPTKRGKWVIERILCDTPPAQPGNVPAFDPQADPEEGSLRDKLEKLHTARGGECASCHAILDPVGFGLEHFDAIGAWRADDNGFEIRTDGKLPYTETAFTDAEDMVQALADDARFRSCIVEQMMSYAIGRSMTPTDDPAIKRIAKNWQAKGDRMPELIAMVSTNPLLRMREGEQ